MEKVEDLFLKMLIHRKEWDKFLTGLHLNVSNSSEIETIDETVAILRKMVKFWRRVLLLVM
ncbi:MAG: hypothetical protein MUW51_06990 [Lactococcus lactis]|nr:hypothetical protein [Lactococcus lactis]